MNNFLYFFRKPNRTGPVDNPDTSPPDADDLLQRLATAGPRPPRTEEDEPVEEEPHSPVLHTTEGEGISLSPEMETTHIEPEVGAIPLEPPGDDQ